MATDTPRITAPERPPARGDTGSLLLAAGGLAAAFGAASCCALPLLLGSLGIGSAWLVAVAWVAAPHRLALLIARSYVSGVVAGCSFGVVALPPARRTLRAVGRLPPFPSWASCPSARSWSCLDTCMREGVLVILESTITCPSCGTAKTEVMPTDACQFFYDCTGCGELLRPKSGDCCVFCSYGSVSCPPIQAGETPTCRPI